MEEFANAIRSNTTKTAALEKALLDAIPFSGQDASQHVPFCGSIACKKLTNMQSVFGRDSDDTDKLQCIEKTVNWHNISLTQQVQIHPDEDEKRAYKGKCYWKPYYDDEPGGDMGTCGVGDTYLQDVYPWLCERYSKPGKQDLGPSTKHNVLHSLLSFDSGCVMNGKKGKSIGGQPLHTDMNDFAQQAVAWCSDMSNWDDFWAHIVLVFAARFYKASARFVDNGKGTPAWNSKKSTYVPTGHAIMHGAQLPSKGLATEHSSMIKQDIVILRPNIEHEMLGLIMGRGGTQELGATFWGQTELSCYDDAQHGIWGMSYKYHERAMVTNERNLIRTYDVAFDGYNGGMDQSHVVWEDNESRSKFREANYNRNQPFHGPSMMVMSFPVTDSAQTWPNPIVYHNANPVGASIDPEKSQGALPNLHEHMMFSYDHNKKQGVQASTQLKFAQYMDKLEMSQWASADQSTRPAGEACIANETSSSNLAFQGSMRILNMNSGACIEDIKGSGHLGHSYVGIASVREGRGVLNGAGPPMMGRMI